MERRAFMALVSGGLLAAPLAAEAQTAGKVPKIGVMTIVASPTPRTEAFRQELGALGYVEGKTIAIEWRWAAGKAGQFSHFAAEFVSLGVDAIVAGGPQAIAAAAKTSITIPVVMVGAADPVLVGLVPSSAIDAPGWSGPKHLETKYRQDWVRVLLRSREDRPAREPASCW
jgi:putative tryptophan/tyrosine transport system substrate-binding protein